MTDEFTRYVEEKRTTKRKIPTDIVRRWNSRVVPRELHTKGAAGADQYLLDYGRGIKAPKLINLARQAEAENCPDMALEFWRRAYTDETGNPAPATMAGSPFPITPTSPPASSPSNQKVTIKGLPETLQPGRIVSMQPVDAPHNRDYYINNDQYWGQPKRDGRRLLIVATPTQAFYQARSTKLQAAPTQKMDHHLINAAKELGSFILDGELYYLDSQGGEHRTGSQAAKINMDIGQPTVPPIVRYAIFKALFALGKDLTNVTEIERIAEGERIGNRLSAQASEIFEVLSTAKSKSEKRELVVRQKNQNREGEVWIRTTSQYLGGKSKRKNPPNVRTKYVKELDVLITELTPSNSSLPFGSAKVSVKKNGRFIPIGSIGTGFTEKERKEIARLHETNPGTVVITIRFQGWTEYEKVWHGRFIAIRDDKKPEDCVI
jgi:bifunctional non-homologous end joining protein LigD